MENRKQPITIDAYAYFSLLVRSSIGVAPLHLLVQMCWSTRYRQGRKSGLLGMTWQYSRRDSERIAKPPSSRYSQGINRSSPAWQLDRKRTIKGPAKQLTGANQAKTRLMRLYSVSIMSMNFRPVLWPERMICAAWAIAYTEAKNDPLSHRLLWAINSGSPSGTSVSPTADLTNRRTLHGHDLVNLTPFNQVTTYQLEFSFAASSKQRIRYPELFVSCFIEYDIDLHLQRDLECKETREILSLIIITWTTYTYSM